MKGYRILETGHPRPDHPCKQDHSRDLGWSIPDVSQHLYHSEGSLHHACFHSLCREIIQHIEETEDLPEEHYGWCRTFITCSEEHSSEGRYLNWATLGIFKKQKMFAVFRLRYLPQYSIHVKLSYIFQLLTSSGIHTLSTTVLQQVIFLLVIALFTTICVYMISLS